MVQERDADQAGPEERGDRAVPGHPPQAADQRGAEERERDDGREPGVHHTDLLVRDQIGGELLL
jgi:hypothetical protein